MPAPFGGYKSENVDLASLSDLDPDEAEALLGKTIARVVGRENSLLLTFTDGSTLKCAGHTWEDSALDVEVELVDLPEATD